MMINSNVPVLRAPVQLKGDQLHIMILEDTVEGVGLLTGRPDPIDEVERAVYMSIYVDSEQERS